MINANLQKFEGVNWSNVDVVDEEDSVNRFPVGSEKNIVFPSFGTLNHSIHIQSIRYVGRSKFSGDSRYCMMR